VGIKKSVLSLVEIPNLVELQEYHFWMKHKLENEWISQDTSRAKQIMSFKFRDYAPHVFQKLRSRSGISDEEYLASLGPDSILNLIWANDYQSLIELCSSGQSGSLFYYTED
jgi:1-phosphatidylinositol-4-phosphate 5-kinase